jgi:hypothetical protein
MSAQRVTLHPGIGPEISESVKDIYIAAGVCVLVCHQTPNAEPYVGTHSVGRGQRGAGVERRKDCDPG